MSEATTRVRPGPGSTKVWIFGIALGIAVHAIAASAQEGVALGRSAGVASLSPLDPCGGTLAYNHDGTFENAYAWRSDGAWPEPNRAWGEAYDLGPVEVVCGAYWLTTLPGHDQGEPANLYIWEGGVTAEPGAVLYVLTYVVFSDIPYWPDVRQIDTDFGAAVSGEFTIGFWGNWGPPHSDPSFWIAADETGLGGHPWTYIAPGLGAPSGWQHPDVVFDPCRSLGIGVYYDDVPVAAVAAAWGTLKALFQ